MVNRISIFKKLKLDAESIATRIRRIRATCHKDKLNDIDLILMLQEELSPLELATLLQIEHKAIVALTDLIDHTENIEQIDVLKSYS